MGDIPEITIIYNHPYFLGILSQITIAIIRLVIFIEIEPNQAILILLQQA